MYKQTINYRYFILRNRVSKVNGKIKEKYIETNNHENYIDMHQCPECNSKNVVRDKTSNELICQNCGLVIAENLFIDEGEFIDFNQSTEGIGYGDFSNSSVPFSTSDSEIGKDKKDIHGNKLSNHTISKFSNLRVLNQRIKNAKGQQRNLTTAYNELNRICAVMNISKEVKEEAFDIYKRATKTNLTHGKKITSLIAASIYASSRIKNVPRTIREISEYSKSSRIEITRAYSMINRLLKLKIPLLSPEDFVSRFSDELQLPVEARKMINKYLQIVKEKYLVSSVLPQGIVATVTYITALQLGLELSQDKIAKIAHVTPITIRNHYGPIIEILKANTNFSN